MARLSAVCKALLIGSEPIRHGVVVKHCVSPSPGVWKSLAVSFHNEGLAEHVWYIHHKGSLLLFFGFH